MGYLTTVTVYNDGLRLLQQYPTEFCQKLYEASGGMEAKNFGLGSRGNFANVQRTRHADDHTIYVHMGNCVTEVNPYDPKFKALMEQRPDFSDKLIKFIESELKELKRLQKAQTKKGD